MRATLNMLLLMPSSDPKKELRKTLRRTRLGLSEEQQQRASIGFIDSFDTQFRQNKPKRVALYLAMDGELDLGPFIEQCRAWQIEVFLPIIDNVHSTLSFGKYNPETQLINNRFSIPEPIHSETVKPWQLDQVLFPLVGFDEQGGRLGMGGGFYDRTFANTHLWPARPKMIGVAHECQKVDHIPRERWDVELEGVLTDERYYAANAATKKE